MFLWNINSTIIFYDVISNVTEFLQEVKDSGCVEVPANSMCPVSISASMQPAAHMSMALV